MKTSLILSTVLCALTLTPAAFANGAQEQTPSVASPVAATAASTSVSIFTVQQLPEVASITRAVLEQLDLDVRADLLDGLRASSARVIQALQVVAPAVAESTGKSLDLSAR